MRYILTSYLLDSNFYEDNGLHEPVCVFDAAKAAPCAGDICAPRRKIPCSKLSYDKERIKAINAVSFLYDNQRDEHLLFRRAAVMAAEFHPSLAKN